MRIEEVEHGAEIRLDDVGMIATRDLDVSDISVHRFERGDHRARTADSQRRIGVAMHDKLRNVRDGLCRRRQPEA